MQKWCHIICVPAFFLATLPLFVWRALTVAASCLPGCKNGGRCVRPGHCKCRRGFKGDRCQHSSSTSLTPSKHKSCVNGGSCKNGGTCNQLTATCQCPFGTYGKFCQKREERKVYSSKLGLLFEHFCWSKAGLDTNALQVCFTNQEFVVQICSKKCYFP